MKKMTAVLGILAGALAAASCARKEKTEAATATRALETAAVVRQTAANRVEVEGVVVGRLEAVLSSRLAARVAEVSAVPGQNVRAGAVLVRLDEGETAGALEGARASLEAARASLELARKNRGRFEKLAERGAAATVELDRARQDEASAAAGVASAEAARRRAEADRAQAVLAAPFDAVVVEKMVSPGDLAGPGRPLVRLASLSGRRVEAAPGEAEAAALSPGQAIDVEVAGRAVTGRIAEIVGAVDPATRRRTVRVDLPSFAEASAGEPSDFEPAVGSFARVFLPGTATPRLLVPEKAVVSRGGLEIAWAVSSDGRVALRYVRTGVRAGGSVEVRSGLEAGEKVVVNPPADLEAGTRVSS
jgi:RND family efflux transporter MFP subunit